jgi:hypothetical protein
MNKEAEELIYKMISQTHKFLTENKLRVGYTAYPLSPREISLLGKRHRKYLKELGCNKKEIDRGEDSYVQGITKLISMLYRKGGKSMPPPPLTKYKT